MSHQPQQRIYEELVSDLSEIIADAVDQCQDEGFAVHEIIGLIAYALIGQIVTTVRRNGMPRERFMETCGKVWDREIEEARRQ